MHTLILGVLLTEFVDDVGRVEAGVVTQCARNDLQSLCKRRDDELLLASNGACMCSEIIARLHLFTSVLDGCQSTTDLNGTATSNNRVVLHGTTHNHNGIVD